MRERKEDIPLLVQQRIPERIVNQLFRYDFPGNIRELENIVERALILSPGKCLDLNAAFIPRNRNPNDQSDFKTLDEMQKEHILKALNQTKWRLSGKMGAATLLGVNPKTLWSKIKKLGI